MKVNEALSMLFVVLVLAMVALVYQGVTWEDTSGASDSSGSGDAPVLSGFDLGIFGGGAEQISEKNRFKDRVDSFRILSVDETRTSVKLTLNGASDMWIDKATLVRLTGRKGKKDELPHVGDFVCMNYFPKILVPNYPKIAESRRQRVTFNPKRFNKLERQQLEFIKDANMWSSYVRIGNEPSNRPNYIGIKAPPGMGSRTRWGNIFICQGKK